MKKYMSYALALGSFLVITSCSSVPKQTVEQCRLESKDHVYAHNDDAFCERYDDLQRLKRVNRGRGENGALR